MVLKKDEMLKQDQDRIYLEDLGVRRIKNETNYIDEMNDEYMRMLGYKKIKSIRCNYLDIEEDQTSLELVRVYTNGEYSINIEGGNDNEVSEIKEDEDKTTNNRTYKERLKDRKSKTLEDRKRERYSDYVSRTDDRGLFLMSRKERMKRRDMKKGKGKASIKEDETGKEGEYVEDMRYFNDIKYFKDEDYSKVFTFLDAASVELKAEVSKRYYKFILHSIPGPITDITQADVDRPYLSSFSRKYYDDKQKKFVNLEQKELYFVAMAVDEPPFVTRGYNDLVRRIARQNSFIPKGSNTTLNTLYNVARMVKDGKFSEQTRMILKTVMQSFILFQRTMHHDDGLSTVMLSKWVKKIGLKPAYALRLDSNSDLRLNLLSQALFTVISSDGYAKDKELVQYLKDMLVFQIIRKEYDNDIKSITNIISLYMGCGELDKKAKHSHPEYNWSIDELNTSDHVTWRQPTECKKCSGGLFAEARAVRKEMFDELLEKAESKMPDLFDNKYFPDFKKNLLSLVKLRYNESMPLIARECVASNVSLYVSSPGAEGLVEELKNVDDFKVKSDEYRLLHEGEYNEYKEMQLTHYRKTLYQATMASKQSPNEVASNLMSYLTTKSASLPRINISVNVNKGRGKSETIKSTTGAKVAYGAFMSDKENIQTKYIYTDSREEYLQRLKEGKNRDGKSTMKDKIPFSYNSIGSRIDFGRNRRHIYNEKIQLYQLATIATQGVVDSCAVMPKALKMNMPGFLDSLIREDDENARQRGIMNNYQRAQNSMIAFFAQLPLTKDLFTISTDASAFDKSSRGGEHHQVFYTILGEVYNQWYEGAKWLTSLPIRVDGKDIGVLGIIRILRDLYGGKQTYVLKDEWSSVTVDMDYTPSGSKITFLQNSISNLAVQDQVRIQYNRTLTAHAVGNTLYQVFSAVSGDDAATTLKTLEGFTITEEMLNLYREVMKLVSLITGYEIADSKGGICVTELMKMYTVLGFVIQHKPTVLSSEKESTSETLSERISRMAVVLALMIERAYCTDDSMTLVKSLTVQTNEFQDYDKGTSTIVIRSVLASTLPNSMGGSSLPLFAFMNEQWIGLATIFKMNKLLGAMMKINDMLKEKHASEIKDELAKGFLAASRGKGDAFFDVSSSDKGLGVDKKNLKGFFALKDERVKSVLKAKSKLGREGIETDPLDAVSYLKSQERKMKELASTIKVPFKQELIMLTQVMACNSQILLDDGKILLNKAKSDDPFMGSFKITKIWFGVWEENHPVNYPSQHVMIRKMVKHYGINTQKPKAFDYLIKVKQIISKYANMKGNMSPPSDVAFLTTLLNSRIHLTLENIILYMQVVFGLDEKDIQVKDAQTISHFISRPVNFVHLSEASTPLVYISDGIMDRIEIVSSMLFKKERHQAMLKPMLVDIMWIVDRPIIKVEVNLDDTFRDATRFYMDRFSNVNLAIQELVT